MLKLLLALALPLAAHDFWIEPSRARLEPGELLKVRLMVGEGWKGEGLRRNSGRILRFSAMSEAGEAPLAGLEGSDPAGLLRPKAPGALWLVYTGTPSRVELSAAKFEAYLREEGLDAIAESRAKARQTARPGRERFRRSAKAFVRVGGSTAGWERPCGLPLEFVPLSDPASLKAGEALTVRLYREGRPLPGQRVVAIGPEGSAHSALTDREGRCTIPLPMAGRWILKAVHMAPVADDPSVDWESLWASLAFEV